MRNAPPVPAFTADDLIAALSSPVGPDAMTAYELAALVGRPAHWVTARLRKLWRDGAGVEMVKVRRPDMMGCERFVPAYRMRASG